MAVYPNIEVGDLVTADLLTSMLPKTYTKTSDTSRSSVVVVANDDQLVSIPLGVGTWKIRFTGRWVTSAGSINFKTQWTFTGTWTAPNRMTIGPGLTNTAAATAVTPSRFADAAAGSDAGYGGGAGPYSVTEEAFDAVVTVAGNLALAWSQVTTSATAVTLKAGSSFEVKQIA